MIAAHRLTPRSERVFQPIAPAPISPGACLFVLPREPSIELFDWACKSLEPSSADRPFEQESSSPFVEQSNNKKRRLYEQQVPRRTQNELSHFPRENAENNEQITQPNSEICIRGRRGTLGDESQFFCHKVRGNIWYAFSQDDFIMLLRDDVDPGKEIEAHPGIQAPFVNKHGVFEYYQIFDSLKDLMHAHWKLTYMMDHEHYPPDYAIVDHGELFLWDGQEWSTTP